MSTLGYYRHWDTVSGVTTVMQYVHQLLLLCMQVTPSHVPKQLFFIVADIYQLMCNKLSTAAYQETRCNPPSERITKNNMWRHGSFTGSGFTH